MKKTFTPLWLCCTVAGWASLLLPISLSAQGTCGTAQLISSSTACVNTTGTVVGAAYEGMLPLGCGTPRYDVWYRFVAQTANTSITLSGIGTAFTNPKLQLLSGTCGTLTSVACSNTSGANQVISATGLTVGATYYIRVFSTNTSGSAPASNGGFSICVRNPAPSAIETSRSYINITKGITGGTVDYLDTLEIRSTLVVRSNCADSLSFLDTLYAGQGLALVPGSIALRTNEGKLYKGYTDPVDGDAGHRYRNAGGDTVVRINFGSGATNTARGKLTNKSRPSFYNSSCIVMATYRVVVYAPYGTKLNFKTGGINYRDSATGIMYNALFPDDYFIVFESPGLCPTAVSATNAIGVEGNGTFGVPSVTPLARNRGTSPYTSYTYMPFTPTQGPQDYYYSIANNTSQVYTTTNTWGKPSSPAYRVFNVWDIIGDHTGAANTARGNPPCDTTKPVSPTNPCGYMLVINSAYKTDTAFKYTVTNLCPGTHYEISAWFRNICYRCGCDSNGTGSGGAGYIPLATGDSSGVQPNIAISVNGVDYYTTGNIPYYGAMPYFGTTASGSDTTNRWVKKGFIYVTGPSETSFNLTIRNNAPGGGGNDWALDDISVATCLPNMKYSPSNTPLICQNNAITIYDTVRSYYNTYNHFKWQRSTDGGTVWTDIAGATGTATPAWNGSAWQYVTAYTIPPVNTTLANTGDKYRVVVGTTAANMLNTNCNFTDGIAIITLNVISCGPPLETRLVSFGGKLQQGRAVLNWTTTKEGEGLAFDVERSTDGQAFFRVGRVQGNAGTGTYSFADSVLPAGKLFYRVVLTAPGGRQQVSHTVLLQGEAAAFDFLNVLNPFNGALAFDVLMGNSGKLILSLTDGQGRQVLNRVLVVQEGISHVSLPETEGLPAGVYILQARQDGRLLTRKVVKR